MALTSEDKRWLSIEVERIVRDSVREMNAPRFDAADATRSSILKHPASIASLQHKVLNVVRASPSQASPG